MLSAETARPSGRWITLLLSVCLTACSRPQTVPANASPEPGATHAPPPSPEPDLSPLERDRRGDEHLRAGRFAAAIADFDVFLAARPEAEPHHWRRGIAYYYAGRFDEGMRQFDVHRTVNPADVENAVWHFLCKARRDGSAKARRALLPVGKDGRVPMMTVYELFAGRAEPGDVLRAAESATREREDRYALFYAHLYLGLFHEVEGDVDKARHHIGLAAGKHVIGHYMGDIAKVHAVVLADR